MITLTMTPTLRAICAHAQTLEIDGAIFARAELIDLLEELKAFHINEGKVNARIGARIRRDGESKIYGKVFTENVKLSRSLALRIHAEINHLIQQKKETK